MSGVPIHSEDPISPAKASGITPQPAYDPNAGNSLQPLKTTASYPYAYPPVQPGVAAPNPTSSIPQSSSYGPPAGVAPVPPPPTITAQSSLPTSPKAGEKALSPAHDAPVHLTPAQPQPYPSQMPQQTVDRRFNGLPPESTTSTSMPPSSNSSAQSSNILSSTGKPVQASLEHPAGYVQNPFASELTPDQRFAAEQQQENRSDTLPSLGYIDDPKGPRLGLEDDETVWGTAKKWAKETGEQATKLGEKVWDKFGPEN
ncbi:MAG: hypothetical protein Q9175_004152 [Cornicularia normoerica]